MSAFSTFPRPFVVTLDMLLWARANDIPPRGGMVRDETERFRAYFEDGPEVSANWPAEWAAWMLRAKAQHTHRFTERGYCPCGKRTREESA